MQRCNIQARKCARQQPSHLVLDGCITLASAGLQTGPIRYVDVPASILYEAYLLQATRGLGDAFAAHTEQAGDQILRDGQFLRR